MRFQGFGPGLALLIWPVAAWSQADNGYQNSEAADMVAQSVIAPQPALVPNLPPPSRDPLRLELADDPIVQFMHRTTPQSNFADYVGQAVEYHPSVDEARAGLDEAEAARREARSGLFPTIDVGISSRTSFARNFSNDPDNVIEQSRSLSRADATFALNQTILDFGATSIRIAAAGARLRAAGFEIERQADQIALRAIASWYDVFTYAVLVRLSENFVERQEALKEDVVMRVGLGASADADIIRVDNLIAASLSRLAGYERQLANAEARFTELYDLSPPEGLARPPIPGGRLASLDAARAAALTNPVVDLVEAQARAALQDSRAARADTLPRVTAGIEGGRFGVFDEGNDYDIRGTINLQHRFFGAADAQADQARARSNAADARLNRVREEAIRFAAIAWTDVQALEAQLDAVEESYITARQARDTLLERFRVARGTLFDVLDAERNYFDAATNYVSVVTELDAARYVLLSRTGRLLPALGITPAVDTNYRVGAQ